MTTPRKLCLLSKYCVYPTPTLSRPLHKGRGHSGKCGLTYEFISNLARATCGLVLLLARAVLLGNRTGVTITGAGFLPNFCRKYSRKNREGNSKTL